MKAYLPVAEQLNLLFETIKHSDGRSYTLQEVSQQTGVSVATISQMRSGHIKNPQINTLRALCQFFNVPLRYFEAHTQEESYAIVSEGRQPLQPGMNEIAFRASSLSPKSQQDVLTIIKWIQAAERQREEGGELPPLQGFDTDDRGFGE